MQRLVRLVFASLTLSVAAGVGFSLHYWGYAWSLPELDQRAQHAKWHAASTFVSADDGHEWSPHSLTLRDYAQYDQTDCCQVGRIVPFLDEPTLVELSPTELRAIERELLARVPLEGGEPGYAFARRLHGIVVAGEDSEGQPLVFASFFGGEVSNDHHAMYDVLLQRGPSPRVLSVSRSYDDVAGIEGFSAAFVSTLLFFLLFPLFTIASAIARWIPARTRFA